MNSRPQRPQPSPKVGSYVYRAALVALSLLLSNASLASTQSCEYQFQRWSDEEAKQLLNTWQGERHSMLLQSGKLLTFLPAKQCQQLRAWLSEAENTKTIRLSLKHSKHHDINKQAFNTQQPQNKPQHKTMQTGLHHKAALELNLYPGQAMRLPLDYWQGKAPSNGSQLWIETNKTKLRPTQRHSSTLSRKPPKPEQTLWVQNNVSNDRNSIEILCLGSPKQGKINTRIRWYETIDTEQPALLKAEVIKELQRKRWYSVGEL